jgi:outer membrane protein TolC
LLDFGRLEGQIDASRAREKEAFALYRLSVIEAVVEVETALSDYANIDKQRADLEQSFISAAKALDLSRRLYNEGEIAFIDLLDAQREVNSAESSLVNAQAAQAESLVRLYKSLGVY